MASSAVTKLHSPAQLSSLTYPLPQGLFFPGPPGEWYHSPGLHLWVEAEGPALGLGLS
jgi:hypothetical protein